MFRELTLQEESDLNEIVCSLHPHKPLLDKIDPKVYILRKGWPSYLKFCKKNRKES